jgi:hypothetical protein
MIIEQIEYSPKNPFKPFIFIGDKIAPSFPIPMAIAENACLTLANSLQIEAIKEIVQPDKLLSRHSQHGNPTNIYEYDFIKTKSEYGYSYTPVPLLPSGYKYWIIELSKYLADPILIQALYLLTKRLTIIAQIGKRENHICHFLISGVFYSKNILFHDPLIIDQNDINELNENYQLLSKFNLSSYKNSFIGKAISDYRDTLDIDYLSPFKIIALFSLIETLMTTNQKNNESSINRQLQKKIVLINNQLSNRINFFEYFKGPNSLTEEVIIGKLYFYRSKIAHGDLYDFSNDLQILIDHETTYNFLDLLFKRLLIYSIKNPQLVIDLKEC